MKISSMALDPIEKKPLARFHPGSQILSIGSIGCTLHCPWCQNHEIALPEDPDAVPYQEMSYDEIVQRALSFVDYGNIGVAYTYNEPFYHWQEVRDCARIVHEHGLLNVVVTNGMISENNLRQLLPFIDAFNVDLKGFNQAVYDLCGGNLETVKRTIEVAHESAHVEVATLIIPGLNDDMDEIEGAARWLASIDPKIPYHLTRFFPQFHMTDRPPTPLATLEAAGKAASKYLDDVILGNC